MKKVLNLCIVIAILGWNMSCYDENKNDGITLVTAEEMQTILELEGVQLVDVRPADEFEKIHITNAQNIDFMSPTFDQDIKKLDKGKPVILYCKGGNQSAKCAKKLKDAGFEKIYDLQGGLSKWEHSGKIQVEVKS